MSSGPDLSKITNDKALTVARKIVDYLKRPAEDPPRPIWRVDDKRVSTGDTVTPLVHGDEYGKSLFEAIGRAQKYVFLTAWAIDPSFRLCREDGTKPEASPSAVSIIGALCDAMQKGVAVRVLEYRNLLSVPSRQTNFSLEILRAKNIPARITTDFPVLHQKTTVIDGRIAFCGGFDPTDLGGDRWDTAAHLAEDKRRSKPYHDAGSWHDVHVRIEGPAVVSIQENFVERWAEGMSQREDDGLPQLYGVPPSSGGRSVELQVVRTIPRRESWDEPESAVAAARERRREEDYSTLESYGRAIVNAQRFIYIENQYFTCTFLIDLMKERLRAASDLSIVVLIPRKSELAVPEDESGHQKRLAKFFRTVVGETTDAAKVIQGLREVAPQRVFVAYRKNAAEKDVYVHAKIMVVDDLYATIGSANLSYRSMFRTDQELGVAWVDAKGASVRAFRRKLWAEHLELDGAALEEREKNEAVMARLWKKRSEDPDWKVKKIREWSPPEPADKSKG